MLPTLGYLLVPFITGALCQVPKTYPLIVEFGATKECKACPHTACVNKPWPGMLDGPYNVTGTCWTSGQAINNLTLWAKTTDGCYFNEWDLDVADGENLRANLTYCGYVEPAFTEVKAKTRYLTDCRVAASVENSDIVKHYKPDVDLTLTCKLQDPGEFPYYRTKYSYCFVYADQLFDVKGASKLPDCGPIRWGIEMKNRDPDQILEPNPDPDGVQRIQAKPVRWQKTTTNPSRKKKTKKNPPPQARSDVVNLSPRALFNNTVNEDGVFCRVDPLNNSSAIIKHYPYGKHIVAQCGEILPQETAISGIGIYTTDNCWVRDEDLEIMIEDETNGIQRKLSFCSSYLDTKEWLPTDLRWGCGATVEC